MKALITGARGFCGTHLRRYLAGQGVEVHGLSHQGPEEPYGSRIEDVTDWQALAGVISSVRPDYVFHLAGIMQTSAPPLLYRVNTQYAVALLHALEEAGRRACPVLLVGTAAEYGLISEDQLPIEEALPPRPYSHYGVSKLAQTLCGLVSARGGRPVVMVRPFNIIGPGMSESLVVQSFAAQIAQIRKQRKPSILQVGNLGTIRDFLGIHEAVRIYWQLIRTPAAYGEVINVCSGRGTAVREVLDNLVELAGCSVEIQTDPSRVKDVDVSVHYGSIRKLRRLLERTPELDLKPLLREMLEAWTDGRGK